MRNHRSAASLLLWLACALPLSAAENDTAEQTPEERIADLEAQVANLAQEVQALKSLLESPVETAPEPISAPAAPAAGNVFNPDIGVNTLLSVNVPSGDLSDAQFDFEETELSIAGVVDPYAQYFGTLVFTGEEVEVEEAYATLPNFPGDLTTTFGRRLVPLGLWNPTHKHAWPMNNPPLVIESLLGAPHLLATGPTAEYTAGESPTWTAMAGAGTEVESSQFLEDGLQDPLLYGRLQGFWDLPDGGVQVGLNVAHGATGESEHEEHSHLTQEEEEHEEHGNLDALLFGIDAKYRSGNQADEDRTLIQGELWLNQREDEHEGDLDTFGWYLLGERQFARDWTAGLRYESAEDPFGLETQERLSAALTWSRTEFTRWRFQYDLTDGDDDALSLQALFTLGPHPAHPF